MSSRVQQCQELLSKPPTGAGEPVEFLMPKTIFDELMDEFSKMRLSARTVYKNNPRFAGVPIKVDNETRAIVLRWCP